MICMNVKMNLSKNFNKPLNSKLAYRGIQHANNTKATILNETVKQGISKSRANGRFYRFAGRLHRASSPFTMPANRSGALRKSMSKAQRRLEFEFGSSIHYAPFLQQYESARVRNSSWKKIAPRPFLTIAHDATKKQFVPIMGRVVSKELGL